jgi:hypothetical protein
MDTISPILQRISRNQKFLIGLSWIALVWFILLPAIIWAFVGLAGFVESSAVLATISTFLVPVIVFALVVFSRKGPIEPFFKTATQMQPKFLAIGSRMDEPWQLLHYMREAPNPMAVETNLIRYLGSSMQSHISKSHQVARIYGAKSYHDLKLVRRKC